MLSEFITFDPFLLAVVLRRHKFNLICTSKIVISVGMLFLFCVCVCAQKYLWNWVWWLLLLLFCSY